MRAGEMTSAWSFESNGPEQHTVECLGRTSTGEWVVKAPHGGHWRYGVHVFDTPEQARAWGVAEMEARIMAMQHHLKTL